MDTENSILSGRTALAERILVTAHDLFYRDGIRATGVDRVIAESCVAKKTFYRYYPTKNDLIVTFLEYRRGVWMTWFNDALQRHGASPDAIVPTLAEWFRGGEYRGCAFINSVVEVGDTLPAAVGISLRHKRDMVAAIERLLPSTSKTAKADARAIMLVIDGAIIGVQSGEPPESVLASLDRLIVAVCGVKEISARTKASAKPRR